VGWSTTIRQRDCQLWAGLPDEVDSYYVHSFVLVPENGDDVVGTCNHGGEFASMVHVRNICAVQFHPEKSHNGGLRMLQNFLALDLDAAC
jgi:glutamine amidotransferase